MSKYLLGAAAAAFLMVGAGGVAQAETLDACGLNAQQRTAGWTCELEKRDDGVVSSTEQAGRSHMCQYFEATKTITLWVAYNPAGNEAEEKNSDPVTEVVGDPVKVGGNVVCPPAE